jgi:acyl carrier protein
VADQRDEIFEAIREHLAARGIDPAKVTMDADLLNDLDLDSLDTVELTLALEEKFNVEIPDSELEGLGVISDAVDLIERKLKVGT